MCRSLPTSALTLPNRGRYVSPHMPVVLHTRLQYSCGGETIAFRNDDDAAIGNGESLRIPCSIKTDSLARRDRHVLVDNAPLQLRTFTDSDIRKQKRIFD